MCYFCDKTCLATLKTSASGAVDFLNQVTSGIEARMKTLMGASTTVSMQGYLLKFPVPAKSYLLFKSGRSRATGVELLANVANNFWDVWVPRRYTQRQPLNTFTQTQGCDVNMLLVSQYDNLWTSRYAGDIDGEAASFGICVGHAFGIVKLKPNAAQMATLLSHEVGHLLGLFHDGPLATMWAEHCTAYPDMPQCAALTAQCTAASHNCPNGQAQCVMNPAVSDEGSYSECSKAYFEGFKGLTEIAPTSFSLACLSEE